MKFLLLLLTLIFISCDVHVYKDECGVVDGDNSTCSDYCGVPNGNNGCLSIYSQFTFETGDFSEFATNNFSSGWHISVNGYESNYCAKSCDIGHNSECGMALTINFTEVRAISFYFKVSSESSSSSFYDGLVFFIDGIKMGEWQGEIDWTEVSYPVSSGIHTFRWVYSKDDYVSSGDDRAWIDYIRIFSSTN